MKAPAHYPTPRLILRQPALGDAAAVFDRYAADPEVTRYLGWARHRSVADTEEFLRFSDREWALWPAGPYLIFSQANGRLLGSTGFAFNSPVEAMTGYVLARDAWKQGFATEALSAITAIAAQIGVRSLYALCHPEHLPSRRVLEKCGFVRDDARRTTLEFPNLQPGVRQDALCYVRGTR